MCFITELRYAEIIDYFTGKHKSELVKDIAAFRQPA